MANTLNATPTVIAQRSLELLVQKYPAISLIASDFSADAKVAGSTVTTQVITPGTAGSFTATGGYQAQDISTSAVNITLNQHPNAMFSLNSEDLTKLTPAKLEQYSNKVASEIGDNIMSTIAALFTTGNYGNSPTAGSTIAAQAVWGFTGVINKANEALSSRNVDEQGRVGIYNSSLYYGLFADSVIRDSPDSYVIGDAKLPVVQDTILTRYNSLPTTSNLVGVQLHPAAVAIATALPPQAASFGGVANQSVETVTHPELGLSVQVATWEDPRYNSLNVSCRLLYGVAVANTGCAQLIRTS